MLPASIEMLPFLHRWDYCWKCELDTDVKIEVYYNGDNGEQLGLYKKVHILDIPEKWDPGP